MDDSLLNRQLLPDMRPSDACCVCVMFGARATMAVHGMAEAEARIWLTLKVAERDWTNCWWSAQPSVTQAVEGTHRSALPVSKHAAKDCGGSPMLTEP